MEAMSAEGWRLALSSCQRSSHAGLWRASLEQVDCWLTMLVWQLEGEDGSAALDVLPFFFFFLNHHWQYSSWHHLFFNTISSSVCVCVCLLCVLSASICTVQKNSYEILRVPQLLWDLLYFLSFSSSSFSPLSLSPSSLFIFSLFLLFFSSHITDVTSCECVCLCESVSNSCVFSA